jgi:hypothetical protein
MFINKFHTASSPVQSTTKQKYSRDCNGPLIQFTKQLLLQNLHINIAVKT